jgi:nucleoside-diphosphate-sugar epimerase
MRYLVIGEGQIGRELITHAVAAGDEVTVLRRSPKPETPGVRRVTGDVLDPAALASALEGADAVLACFHAPYDARKWAVELPPRERAVLDAADEHDVPVVFPESMYGFQGAATNLREGAAPAPLDAKGRIRIDLLAARRAHRARTVSVIAADLVGPTTVGTFGSVACAMVLERVAQGRRAIVVGDPAAPHSLTFVPDLALAMLHAARNAASLTGDARDAVLNAPSAPARSQAELIAAASEIAGERAKRPIVVPRFAPRALAPVVTFARELNGIGDLWYRPCVLAPGVLETEQGLAPTPWTDALRETWAAIGGEVAENQRH